MSFKLLTSNVSLGNAGVAGHSFRTNEDGSLHIGREDGVTNDAVHVEGDISVYGMVTAPDISAGNVAASNLSVSNLSVSNVEVAGLAVDSIVLTDANGGLVASNVAPSQLYYIDNVTDDIQFQLDTLSVGNGNVQDYVDFVVNEVANVQVQVDNLGIDVSFLEGNLSTLQSQVNAINAMSNIVTVTTNTDTYTATIDCSKGRFFNWNETAYVRNGNYLGASVVGSSSVSSADSADLTLPSIKYFSGDIILVGYGDSAGAISFTDSSYTTLHSASRFVLAYKVYDGSSSLDTSVSCQGEGGMAGFGLVIRGATATGLVSALATGFTGMPDPPSITANPPEAVYVACGFLDDDNVKSSVTAPTGYTLQAANQASNTPGFTVMCATRVGNIGTENPAAFGGSGTDEWWGVTLAFPSYGKINVDYTNAPVGQVVDVTLKMTCNANVVPSFNGNIMWSERFGPPYTQVMNNANTYLVKTMTIDGNLWHQDVVAYKTL